MDDPGSLSAEMDGPLSVKLTMTFPDGYDHAATYERQTGTDPKTGDPVWEPVHTGNTRFVQGDVAYDLAPTPLDGSPPQPLTRPRTYRALAHKHVEASHRPGGVPVVETHGTYTEPVTV